MNDRDYKSKDVLFYILNNTSNASHILLKVAELNRSKCSEFDFHSFGIDYRNIWNLEEFDVFDLEQKQAGYITKQLYINLLRNRSTFKWRKDND